jgi:acetyltransferase-like isoleucine patch superfamily enzyme
MKKTLKYVRNIALSRCNVMPTIILGIRKRNTCLAIFPNVHVSMATSSSVVGNGFLKLGCRWEGLRYLPSEIKLANNAQVVINSGFSIYTGLHVTVNENASLIFGSGYINNNVTIDCFEKISFGNNVAISKGVTFRDSDNHSINGNKIVSAPIIIDDNVWIGVNVTVLKGVRIGRGSVIAAGAVVTRSVPENTLVGGVPSRIIKKDITWA